MVIVKRHVFNSLDDASLIWTCIEPTIKQIRGRSFEIKLDVSNRLNNGQQALLMFQMLYGHTVNGVKEFFGNLSYLLSKKGVWSQLKNGIRYFGDYGLLNLLDEMEEAYNKFIENNGMEDSEGLEINATGIDSDIHKTINSLDKRFYEILPATIKLIGSYIRNYPNEFLQIEE